MPIYKNPPLVYMSIRVNTQPLLLLNSDQQSILDQKMLREGYAIQKVDQATQIQISGINVSHAPHPRRAYFKPEMTTSLIIDALGFDWRTTNYLNYKTASGEFSKIIKPILNTIDIYGGAIPTEITLSYSDLIVPKPNRSLADYFQRGEESLPLNNFLRRKNAAQSVGVSQTVDIIGTNKRSSIIIEQIPLVENKISKLLSDSLLEPVPEFGMPIITNSTYMDGSLQARDYVILTTQASTLCDPADSASLKDLDLIELTDEIHNICSEDFKRIINHEVCDIDWVKTST